MTDPKTLFPDLNQLLSKFQIPGVDLAAMIEARQADIEAVKLANHAALNGAQRLIEKQSEILHTAMTELSTLFAELPQNPGGNPSAFAGKQSELVQAALARALASIRELAEAAKDSQTAVYEVLSKRVEANLADLKKFIKVG